MDQGNDDKGLRKVIEAGIRKSGSGPKDGQKGKPKGPRSDYLQIEPETPGYKLIQVIFERAVSEGLASTDLAEHLGIAPSTLSHLKTGRRLASSLGRDVIEKFAEWLNYPVLAVLILAEQVRLEDFYSPRNDLDRAIDRALQFMADDPEWGGMMPKDIEGASTHMKLWSVWMYERATKTRLIPGGIDYLDLLKSMDEFRGEYPSQK
ncbi:MULTISPECIES: helix-turn-helix domain-containing protein [Halomonadaceae]|uniref:helix-turn-helix domain-containing protein n=2 Tax=Oceanospirillales TaxID=135619 RepID=UPI0003117DC3|nr:MULTISPECIES: helix-turn-helix transcriptional regulator [Halomonadaceae]MBL1267721.1 helix-turn-helix transcriptional regulator [Halomonas sp.]MEA2118923.1 helix-turn-helix transcriptional regulator [Halovibrio sp. HP20-59]WKV95147.1 helix-turn-helix transcriptional regulator [Halomonas sp. HAL1]